VSDFNHFKGQGVIEDLKMAHVGQNKTPKASFKLVIPRSTGQGSDKVPVVAWQDLAEELYNAVGDGMRVITIGSVSVRNWRDRSDKWNTTIEVAAETVTPLESEAMGAEPQWSEDDDPPF
jgi:single-stranded DNA-binding protein